MATNYAYDMGATLGAIRAEHSDKITATAIGNISMRPDLMRAYLRHLDLSGYDIPAKPATWHPNSETQMSFWLGYYQAGASVIGMEAPA